MPASLFPSIGLTAPFILAGMAIVAFSGSVSARENSSRELVVTNRYTLPLLEISGLAPAPALDSKGAQTANRSLRLYAVGDATREVVTFYIDGSSGGIVISLKDAALPSGRRAAGASQWEAVAADGVDTVCMLSETDSKVSCFDDRINENRGIITLDTSPLKHLNRLWGNRPNSRGEGMLLMKKGHLLILKEKKPSLLVEFGPQGDLATGYGPDTFLAPDEAFALPSRAPGQQEPTLVALKSWEFSDRLRELASDASEITLGPDGHVYLLSHESSTLIRLEKVLKPDEEKVNINDDAWWILPKGIGKTEGLAIDSEMRPWIAVDRKQKEKPNLFRLSLISPGAEGD
ncbi:MAG TPA: SdiA-regulated domain-containing protein [Nitrosospira sp.]|nr:SdiA-regulated domain-containing protein [Nitrosospira sp.]